jgi:hypothetical protein
MEVEVPAPTRIVPVVVSPIISPKLDLGSTSSSGTIDVVAPPGSPSLTYTVTTNQSWLAVTPASFILDTGTRSIRVSVDRTGLTPGPHTGQVTVAYQSVASSLENMVGGGYVSSSSVVPVSVEVSGAPATSGPGDGGTNVWVLVVTGLGVVILLAAFTAGIFHQRLAVAYRKARGRTLN